MPAPKVSFISCHLPPQNCNDSILSRWGRLWSDPMPLSSTWSAPLSCLTKKARHSSRPFLWSPASTSRLFYTVSTTCSPMNVQRALAAQPKSTSKEYPSALSQTILRQSLVIGVFLGLDLREKKVPIRVLLNEMIFHAVGPDLVASMRSIQVSTP